LWLTISASAGASFKVEMKKCVARMTNFFSIMEVWNDIKMLPALRRKIRGLVSLNFETTILELFC
jgi:hypothetical protein